MEQRKRPLSPHLQVYRLPLTGIVSIMHRITGVMFTAGLMLFVISLVVIQCGASSYASMQQLLHNPLIGLILWAMMYALFFHLCHGIRHLIWDLGEGYEKPLMNYYLLLELSASVILTVISFLFVQLGS